MPDDAELDLTRRGFRSWLLAQAGRQDEVGRLARWMRDDDCGQQRPRTRTGVFDLADHLALDHEDVALMQALVVAFAEWGGWLRGSPGADGG